MSLELPLTLLLWHVQWSDEAERQLDDLEPDDALAILTRIGLLASVDNPCAALNVKALQMYAPPLWRLRCGKFRILFRLDTSVQDGWYKGILDVMEITNRKDAYVE